MLSRIWAGFILTAVLFSFFSGNGSALTAAVSQGAQAGITLAISIAGPLCLWTGVGHAMEKAGITGYLARLLRPLLRGIFPSCRSDAATEASLSANICANLLGLGNAATPMGIRAAKAMKRGNTATNELCRLIVLNTASIQLLPTNVAAVRSALGAAAPFDILGAVWITSFLSAGLGLLAAWLLGKVWPHD